MTAAAAGWRGAKAASPAAEVPCWARRVDTRAYPIRAMAGASHKRVTAPSIRPDVGKRKKQAITQVPQRAWHIAVDRHGRSGSAALTAPVLTAAAAMPAAGSRKRMSPS